MADLQESGRKLPRLSFPMAVVPIGMGAKVREMRKARRLSQGRFAVKAGLDRATVQRLEAGRPSTADTIFRVAYALGIEAHRLVPGWAEWEPVKGTGQGARVRQRRLELGLTLREVAKATGVSEATLSRLERGVCHSPALLRVEREDLVIESDELAVALGFRDKWQLDAYCEGTLGLQ